MVELTSHVYRKSNLTMNISSRIASEPVVLFSSSNSPKSVDSSVNCMQ